MISELEGCFKKNPNFVLTNYSGLSTQDLTQFRKEIKKAKTEYLVVKNTLCRKVLEKMKMESLNPSIEGNCGIAFIEGDCVEASKAILGFAKTHEPLVIKAAFIEGAVLDQNRLKALAALPSREVLLSMALAGMKAPVSGFVNVLSGVMRNFVYAVNAIKEKKSKS